MNSLAAPRCAGQVWEGPAGGVRRRGGGVRQGVSCSTFCSGSLHACHTALPPSPSYPSLTPLVPSLPPFHFAIIFNLRLSGLEHKADGDSYKTVRTKGVLCDSVNTRNTGIYIVQRTTAENWRETYEQTFFHGKLDMNYRT